VEQKNIDNVDIKLYDTSATSPFNQFKKKTQDEAVQ